MAERRYSFRFSLPEGCVILVSLLLTSFLVFLFGVYVGKEVEAHKAAQQTRTARLSVSASGETVPARPASDTPAVHSPLPAEKLEAAPAVPNSPVSAGSQNAFSSSGTVAPVAPKKSPQPALPSNPIASAAVPAKSSSPSPVSSGSSAVAVSKPQPASPPNPVASVSVPAKPPPSSPPTSTTSAVIPLKPKPASQANTVTPAPPVTAVGAEFDSKEKTLVAPSKRWAVQVQATTQETAAQSVAKQLREQGLSPVVSKVERQGEVWYRVRVGKFTSEEEAEATVSRFRHEGKFTQAYPVLE